MAQIKFIACMITKNGPANSTTHSYGSTTNPKAPYWGCETTCFYVSSGSPVILFASGLFDAVNA